MLYAIGRKLQAMAIKKLGVQAVWYDSHHWDRIAGKAMNSERHAYRLPLGWVDKANRAPLPYHPLGGELWTVRQAWQFLGKPNLPKLASEMPVPADVAKKGKGKGNPKNTKSGKGAVGSLAVNNAEWTCILNSFWGGIRQGLGKDGAIEAVVAKTWDHHTAARLRTSLGAIDISKKWGNKKYTPHTTNNNLYCGAIDTPPLIPFSGSVGPMRMLQRRFDPRSHFLQSSYELMLDFPPALVLRKMQEHPKYAPIISDVKAWLGAEKWEAQALTWLEWQAINGMAPRFWCAWDWLEQLHQVLATRQATYIKCDESLRLAVVALHPPIQHDWQCQGSSMRHLQRGMGLLVQAGIIKLEGKGKATKYAIPANYRARLEAREDQLGRANRKAASAIIEPTKNKKNMKPTTKPTDPLSADDRKLLHHALNHPVLREKYRDLLEDAGLLPLAEKADDDMPPDVDDDDMPPVVEKVAPAPLLPDESISSAKQEKLERRSLKNVEKLGKLRALAGRKSRKSASTERLQEVVQTELDKAFRAAQIDPTFYDVFEVVYLDFLLACSFEVAWNDEKKSRFARYTGFSLGECLAWIYEPGSRGNFGVARELKFLKTTHWTKSEEVFLSPKWATEDHLEALEIMAEAGEVLVATADQIRTVDILQRNLARYADEISTLIKPAEIGQIVVNGQMVNDGYFFVWKRVRELATAKFEKLLNSAIAESDPLFASAAKVVKLHIPRRQTSATRYVHSAKIGEGKEKMVMPVRSALEKIKAGFAG